MGASVPLAIWILLMFSFVAEPGWRTAIASIFATLMWLFYGCFWWTFGV